MLGISSLMTIAIFFLIEEEEFYNSIYFFIEFFKFYDLNHRFNGIFQADSTLIA